MKWDDFEAAAERIVSWALAEDAADRDVTTLAMEKRAEHFHVCHVVARENLIVAGWPLVCMTYRLLSDTVTVAQIIPDGSAAMRGSRTGDISGKAGFILRGERVALNLLCRLSGIATITSRFVDVVSGTGTEILDTRKTTPCHRILERYAVRMGGGVNHRFDLSSMAMIKDNHIAAMGGMKNVSDMVRRLRRSGTLIEIEVDSLDQLREVLLLGPDRILLDNMSPAVLKDAVEMSRGSGCYLEASGGVTLDTVRQIAETGVDGISVGALTHSAGVSDIGFDWSNNYRE